MQATQVLEKLRELGFQFLTLPRYERQVAAERDGFVALLEYTAAAEIRQFGSAGYLIEGQIGLLIQRGPASFFVAKNREVLATPDLLDRYGKFQQDLHSAQRPPAAEAQPEA